MKYQIIERNEKHVKAIIKALKNAEGLYLATDPDREGEAISWHLVELLKEKGILDKIEVHRVVFHEITKQAVRDAVANPVIFPAIWLAHNRHVVRSIISSASTCPTCCGRKYNGLVSGTGAKSRTAHDRRA